MDSFTLIVYMDVYQVINNMKSFIVKNFTQRRSCASQTLARTQPKSKGNKKKKEIRLELAKTRLRF